MVLVLFVRHEIEKGLTMEKEFWMQAWEDRRIGFHQSQYNPVMTEHYKDLELKDKNVLIPLAGKSKDILYFIERGANVTAIELSEMAVKEFFEENGIVPQLSKTATHTIYESQGLKFVCGDFFSYSPDQGKHFDYYYDRACIVALPMEMRQSYYKKIESLIAIHTDIFIITFAHNGPKDFGPPFYVPEEEILTAYKNIGFDLNFTVFNESKAEGRFKEAGIDKMKRLHWKKQI